MKVVYDLILKTLQQANIAPVYAFGAHKGIIDGGTIVVQPGTSTQYYNYSTTIQYYNILCYGRTASEVIDLFDKAQEAMKSLEVTVMPTHMSNMPFFDTVVHAWQISGTYRNYVKNT